MSTNQAIQPEPEQHRKQFGEDFCFHCHYQSIAKTQSAYAYYEDNKRPPKELYKSSIPIAIDTNVLLDLYSISFKERTQFLRFINENAHRIIITAQVQREYMTHRLDAIQSFRRTLKELAEFPKKAQENIRQTFETALNQLKSEGNRRIVANDMADVPAQIKAVKEFIEQHQFGESFLNELDQKFTPLIESVKKGVDESLDKAVYELNDPVLATLSKTKILDPITTEEEAFLRKQFERLLVEFNDNKLNSNKKDLFTFPGCGDRKKMKEGRDSQGDFFIYHELLSYMFHNNKDVVYLTNDVKKSDWVKQDGRPFNHYIVDTYVNTGHMLYILNARDFTTLSFEAVAEVDSTESDDATDDAALVPPAATDAGAVAEHTVERPTTEPSPERSDTEQPQMAQGEEAQPTEVDQSEATVTEERGNNFSYLRDVSRERFLQELDTALIWAESYGDGYVGKDYFIYSILGHKRFHFSSSHRMLQSLIEEGSVIVVDETHDGRDVKCLKKAAQRDN